MSRTRKLERSIEAPPPKGGSHRRITLPDDWRGIQYEIGRMAKHIQDQYLDPEIVDAARQIAGRWCRFVEDMSAKNGDFISCFGSQVIQLEGLFIWCKHHFVYVNDPVNKEVIQTPLRELRQTHLSREFINMMMEPFYAEMEERDVSFNRDEYVPPQMVVGDCDEANQLCLTMAAALGMHPIKFRFGSADGAGGDIHHVWCVVEADGREFDIDFTDPSYGLGDAGDYSYTEDFLVIE